MKALISTSHSILVVDTERAEAFAIDRSRGLYYGLVRTDNGFVAGARRRMLSSDIDRAYEMGCLITFPKDAPSGTLEAPFPMRDIHGMCFVDHSIWVTCSLDEKVAIFENGVWSEWFPLGPPPEAGVDKNHFNTLCCVGERLYVVAHRFGDSAILEFDKGARSLNHELPLGNNAHNVWFDGDKIRICSSGEGRIIGKDGFCVETGGFPRGYACDSLYRLVGVNQITQRAARDSTISTILLMDMDYRERQRLALPGEGAILDVLAISDDEFEDLFQRFRKCEFFALPKVEPGQDASLVVLLKEAETAKSAYVQTIASLTNERDALAARLSEVSASWHALNGQLAERTQERDHWRARSEPVGHSDLGVQKDMLFLLQRLAPKKVQGYEKIRVGGPHDGGYVMLNDFVGVEGAYSFGIGDDVSWDNQIADLGIPIFQYDHSIDALPQEHANFHWRKTGLAPCASGDGIFETLPALIDQNAHASANELLLKMDIEDAEWDVLGALDAALLHKFRQIVIELHFLERIGRPEMFHRMLRAVSTLTAYHEVIHVHGNNFGKWTVVGGVSLPNVVELTLVRKAGKVFSASDETFPTPLDRPNRAGYADCQLGCFRF